MTSDCKFYVYIITNNILNKQYVGSKICYHKNLEEDGYMGSSKHLKKDYQIFGLKNFSKKILEYYENPKDMLNGESAYMHQYNTFSPNGYNRFDPKTKNGFHMAGIHPSEETKLKWKNRIPWNKDLKQSAEVIENRVKKNTGQTRTQETKNQMSKVHLNHEVSEITKERQSKALINHSVSETTKEKMKNAKLGKSRGNYNINKIIQKS
jgi:group I intron endonuclease